MPTKPKKSLDTFPNPELQREYTISFSCPEFTCLCPKTGQPDFGTIGGLWREPEDIATISIRYVPARVCVELKSLKLYLWSFRNEGHFHESVTNLILDDLVRALRPRSLEVVGDFYVRGGIHTVITVTHTAKRRG